MIKVHDRMPLILGKRTDERLVR
ncbi:MAG: hypothetical protein V8T13_04745 [[Ruminococcus] lactaris]